MAMARSANFMASALLPAENFLPDRLFSGELGAQMNVEAAGRRSRGRCGHSGASLAGGLITVQLAKLIVRDHR